MKGFDMSFYKYLREVNSGDVLITNDGLPKSARKITIKGAHEGQGLACWEAINILREKGKTPSSVYEENELLRVHLTDIYHLLLKREMPDIDDEWFNDVQNLLKDD